MKSQPARRAIQRVLLVNRVVLQAAAAGVWMFEKIGPVPELDRFQAGDARAISFRPPENPAMKCGSIRPVVIFRSALA